jgi:hypothetical protein
MEFGHSSESYLHDMDIDGRQFGVMIAGATFEDKPERRKKLDRRGTVSKPQALANVTCIICRLTGAYSGS